VDAFKPYRPACTPSRGPTPSAPVRSPLVARLIQPGIDSGRRRIRMLLSQLPDASLRSGLGLSDADVAALRAASLADLAAAGATATADHRVQQAAETLTDLA
jgi:hypothetical protein